MASGEGPFSGTRWNREKERKRSQILDAAEPVFRRKGYRNATTEEIARESGYSVGTVYNLFKDKETLYARVLERLGRRLLTRIDHAVLSEREPMAAIQTLIKVRLFNYREDRLFFQPFACDGDFGIPDASRLPKSLRDLYDRYFGTVAELFRQAAARGHVDGLDPRHLAMSLEGIVHAFMGFWSGPEQSDHQDQIARHICAMLFSPGGEEAARRQAAASAPDRAETREIYVSKFDRERLKELVLVARCFGKGAHQEHLDELEAKLDRARIVSPSEAPGDLVTMNSRVLLRDLDTGAEAVCLLTFPKDAAHIQEGVSILERLGTALLGSRVNDILEVSDESGRRAHKVERIMYQPEAAGDYHL